ncbi:MAG: ribonuclease P protein component 1 [Candidatus Aenigmarchaeota archaeon]|nr:ribonuclease P protein component 1 [Candidatus Aenigmarchaeota archaeon]MDI6722036.1 ribonuclease P protein component 1 [Candidatus Aenigmarchaeota archaeon]
MRKPQNILMHELIGLSCEIVSAKNKFQNGLKGKVIDETMKNIIVETGMKRKTVPKKGTTFRFDLSSCAVNVNGNALVGRPEDRIKKKFSKW